MIVIAKGVGRLANRLVLFAHVIGAAVEHGLSVANPAFWLYARHFPSTAGDLLCRFPPWGRRVGGGLLPRRALYQATAWAAGALAQVQRAGGDVGLIRLRRDQSVDLDGDAFLAAARRHRLLFIQDWWFRSTRDCQRHRDVIRAFLTPWEHHLARARAAVEPARRRGRMVIGVHVRRGDYARFKAGRFYFSHAQYRTTMASVAAAFPSESVSFLICSDEPVPAGAFEGFDVLPGPGDAVGDLYALSACDRLIGPPSTYTAWASYYGAVPRYAIADPAAPVGVASFRVDWTLGGTVLSRVGGSHAGPGA